jgi:hypothetical protein
MPYPQELHPPVDARDREADPWSLGVALAVALAVIGPLALAVALALLVAVAD